MGICRGIHVKRYVLTAAALFLALPGTGVYAAAYSIQGDRSAVRILVYRSGALAAAGHNHVITSRALRGTLSLDGSAPEGATFQLVMAVDSLEVDRPEDRAAAGAGFGAAVGDEARTATRRNMIGAKGLNRDRYPEIRASGYWSRGYVYANIELHGIVRQSVVPVQLERTENGITARGRFSLNQSDYGMTPFRALAGALRVRDQVDIEFRIVATE
jgi:hypothetical protein